MTKRCEDSVKIRLLQVIVRNSGSLSGSFSDMSLPHIGRPSARDGQGPASGGRPSGRTRGRGCSAQGTAALQHGVLLFDTRRNQVKESPEGFGICGASLLPKRGGRIVEELLYERAAHAFHDPLLLIGDTRQ